MNPSDDEKSANKYAEGCDNESGSFLSHQLEAIRAKAFKAGLLAERERSKGLLEALERVAQDYYAKDEFLKQARREILEECIIADTNIAKEALAKYRGEK